ncbi:hypothetical protein SMICM304S_05846 [Streptomyces microflavus]
MRLNPLSGDGPGIVFAPPAGGTVLGYIELARHLRGFGEIHGVEAPGLGAGESPVYPSFDEMVQFCSDSAGGAGDGVYIGGHGGHIAFYLATMLRNGASGRRAYIPNPPRLETSVADADLTEEETRAHPRHGYRRNAGPGPGPSEGPPLRGGQEGPGRAKKRGLQPSSARTIWTASCASRCIS